LCHLSDGKLVLAGVEMQRFVAQSS
jgi:hypothetical protein